MKQALLLFPLLTTSIFAFSDATPQAQYDIKTELFLDGKKVASPKFLVTAGNIASASQHSDGFERFIEVTADESEINGIKGILMKFVIGTVSAEGQKTILARPQILSRQNEKAQIIVDPAELNSHLELTVVASKKML